MISISGAISSCVSFICLLLLIAVMVKFLMN